MVATLLRSSLIVIPVRPIAKRIVRKAVSGARRFHLPKWKVRSFDDFSLEETSRLAEVLLRSGIR